MQIEEYLADPCMASSLPYWKTESFSVPKGITIIRDDMFSGSGYSGNDEPYFKMIHHLQTIPEAPLPEGYGIIQAGMDDFAAQINSCYTYEYISADELLDYRSHPVYMPELWVAVADLKRDIIVATGIAEYDSRIGEGILEWIQVLPEYRRKGLGAFIICELLRRLRLNQARFVTVSGRMNNESGPYALYTACGFGNPVIWHVVKN